MRTSPNSAPVWTTIIVFLALVVSFAWSGGVKGNAFSWETSPGYPPPPLTPDDLTAQVTNRSEVFPRIDPFKPSTNRPPPETLSDILDDSEETRLFFTNHTIMTPIAGFETNRFDDLSGSIDDGNLETNRFRLRGTIKRAPQR